MDARLLIASGKDGTMRYATGLVFPDPFIYVRIGEGTERKEYALVKRLDERIAKERAKKGIKTIPIEEVSLENIRAPTHRQQNLADVAASFLLEKTISDVLISETLWTVFTETLREHAIRPKILSPYFPERIVKTDEEIACISAAGKAAEDAIEHAVSLLKEATIEWDDRLVLDGEPLTSERVRATIDVALLHNGCSSEETIVACNHPSPREQGTGELKAGKPIVIDICARHSSGHHCRMARTFVRGTPGEDLDRLYNTILRAQKDALAITAPGSARQVHEAVASIFRKAGYKTNGTEGFIQGTGHGIGLDIHEPPRLNAQSKDALKEGMTLTIGPGLYYEDLGGVRIEDTVLVTQDGCKSLTDFTKSFVIE